MPWLMRYIVYDSVINNTNDQSQEFADLIDYYRRNLPGLVMQKIQAYSLLEHSKDMLIDLIEESIVEIQSKFQKMRDILSITPEESMETVSTPNNPSSGEAPNVPMFPPAIPGPTEGVDRYQSSS